MTGAAIDLTLESLRCLTADHRCEQLVEVFGRPSLGPRSTTRAFGGTMIRIPGSKLLLLDIVFRLHGYG